MNKIKISAIEYYNSAIESVKENNITNAISMLEKAYEVESKNIEINNLLGLCYFKKCYFKKAIFIWERSIEIDSEINNKAHSYLNTMRNNKILQDIGLYNETLNMIVEGKKDSALKKLLTIENSSYGWSEVYILISLLNIEKKRYDKAKDFLDKAVKCDIGNYKANYYYALILSMDNQVEGHKFVNKNKALALIAISIIFTTLLVIIVNTNNKNLIIANENSDITKKLMEKEHQLEESNKYKENLEATLTSFQEKLDELMFVEEKILDYDEMQYLSNALEYFENEMYNQSIKKFEIILNNSENKLLINEATYWVAEAYRIIGDEDSAIEYFKSYIEQFSEYYYYDDALYNLSIILSRNGEIEMSKRYAEMLYTKCNDSIFNNDIIYKIMEQ